MYFKAGLGADWFEKYSDFKLFISDKSGAHFNDIAIAGSAKLGFSANPSKNYRYLIFDLEYKSNGEREKSHR